ncbi:uncharacterized protein IL334_000884 [Kwoniella shivajii]|uniref:Transcription initiation factor TFIID subunit 1 n=1 Tax=Kwoniella shivajii TaxID=564305 RepID=A0ABZ1CUN2_9TREE|nr:hypothetical protein IL334_000884 [Kwoniella shivajii]
MATEDEALGSVGSFGLSSVLASAGIDINSLGSFLGEGSGTSSRQIAEIEAEDNEDKYEDDISDDGLPAENDEDTEARKREQEARKREEERWIRKGMELAMEADKGKGKGKLMDGMGKSKKEKELDQLRTIWPGFEKGKRLRMSEIFYETPADRKAILLQKRKKRRLEKGKEFTFTVDHTSLPNLPATFLLPSLPQLEILSPDEPNYKAPIGSYFDKEWVREAKSRRRREMTKPPSGMEWTGQADAFPKHAWQDDLMGQALELEDWEKGIIMCSLNLPAVKPIEPLAPRNGILDSGDWLNDVIWDARRVSPDLLESEEEDILIEESTRKTVTGKGITLPVITKLDPFNLSNDHLYEHSREARYRIRQTFGAIEVFHSGPAKQLQLPFYKTTFTKSEARAWHRPALQFPTGVTFGFSKLKSNPSASVSSKKKQIVADPSERFKTTKDLTLTEKGPYVLFEFSEEYPPIMSNYGMGTTIVNYYRKKDEKDEHVPKLDFGQPSILNPGDAEPFMLGYVDRGEVTQVIHNNLLRAPIFRHTPETTDFLVIRQTVNGHSTFNLRAISNIFTVGQSVPNESEIHAPHARKNTNTSKMRLMIIAWLLITKSKQKRFKMSKLLKYFPDQTELQMRQRLKEFLTFARQPGPNQGYWMLNPEYEFPSDRKEVLELCSPEAAALFEAMQVGARHLHDAGYHKTAEGGQEDEDETGQDIEQQLAVWETTHNYKLAEAQKAWLVVHGEGDPTGRGEGFSFLRANMKNYFLRKGETEQGRRLEAEAKAGGNVVKISNAEQNRIYEEEKRKVWDLQWNSLSNPNPPELRAEEDDERPITSTPAGLGPRFNRDRGDSRRAFSRGNSVATPMYADSPRESSPAFSMDGESTYTGNPSANKVLRIKRKIKGKEQVEIVRDPAVISAYLRKLEDKKLEFYMENVDQLEATGNEEDDEIRKAALRKKIEQYKLNQQRRLMRKKYASRTLDPDNVDGVDMEGGKRKCGACGQIGHTKANRNCPMFNASVAPSPSMSAGAATPSGFGGYTPVDTIDNAPTPSTSFKIRLGGGQR